MLRLHRALGHTSGMTTTTIKVPTQLRDVLKSQARESGSTLAEHLEHLAMSEARRRRHAELERAIAANPPDDDYRREAAAWQNDAWI